MPGSMASRVSADGRRRIRRVPPVPTGWPSRLVLALRVARNLRRDRSRLRNWFRNGRARGPGVTSLCITYLDNLPEHDLDRGFC